MQKPFILKVKSLVLLKKMDYEKELNLEIEKINFLRL